MTDTTGNFQDLLQFSQDTLYCLGEALSVGNSAASTVTHGFSNSGGQLMLAAAQTTNQTVWFPSNSSGNATLLTNVLVSAGTTSFNLSAVEFSNSNGVSFGFNGSTITASVNAGAGGGVAIADDNGNTISNSTVQFSNSNNVSFGLNGSTMTASYGLLVSGNGGTSNVVSSLEFGQNAYVGFGGVSFFILTGPGVATIQGAVVGNPTINVSAGTTSGNVSAVTFKSGNNVSFGFDGSNITAQASALQAISAGTLNDVFGSVDALVFSNSNNVSFGMSSLGGATAFTITASVGLTGDWYDNIAKDQPTGSGSGAMGSISNFTGSHRSLFVSPLHGYGDVFPYDITAGTCFFPDVSISGSTATMSIAFTSKWYLGVYTLNASSLSLLNSVSVSFGFAGAATNNSTAFAGGFRFATIDQSAWSSSPVFKYGSRYWLAWFWSSSGVANQTDAMAGAFMFSSGQRSGLLGVSNLTGTSNGWAPFYGIYTATTNVIPASIGSNELQKTASMAGFVPHLIMANNASLTVF
jgi:hypothetical protein